MSVDYPAALVLRHLLGYVALGGACLRRCSRDLFRAARFGFVALGAGVLAVLMLHLTMIAAVWDTNSRLWVLGALSVAWSVVAALAWSRARRPVAMDWLAPLWHEARLDLAEFGAVAANADERR
jgi:hypothetical protein